MARRKQRSDRGTRKSPPVLTDWPFQCFVVPITTDPNHPGRDCRIITDRWPDILESVQSLGRQRMIQIGVPNVVESHGRFAALLPVRGWKRPQRIDTLRETLTRMADLAILREYKSLVYYRFGYQPGHLFEDEANLAFQEFHEQLTRGGVACYCYQGRHLPTSFIRTLSSSRPTA